VLAGVARRLLLPAPVVGQRLRVSSRFPRLAARLRSPRLKPVPCDVPRPEALDTYLALTRLLHIVVRAGRASAISWVCGEPTPAVPTSQTASFGEFLNQLGRPACWRSNVLVIAERWRVMK
jgi:hypothetical protein